MGARWREEERMRSEQGASSSDSDGRVGSGGGAPAPVIIHGVMAWPMAGKAGRRRSPPPSRHSRGGVLALSEGGDFLATCKLPKGWRPGVSSPPSSSVEAAAGPSVKGGAKVAVGAGGDTSANVGAALRARSPSPLKVGGGREPAPTTTSAAEKGAQSLMKQKLAAAPDAAPVSPMQERWLARAAADEDEDEDGEEAQPRGAGAGAGGRGGSSSPQRLVAAAAAGVGSRGGGNVVTPAAAAAAAAAAASSYSAAARRDKGKERVRRSSSPDHARAASGAGAGPSTSRAASHPSSSTSTSTGPSGRVRGGGSSPTPAWARGAGGVDDEDSDAKEDEEPPPGAGSGGAQRQQQQHQHRVPQGAGVVLRPADSSSSASSTGTGEAAAAVEPQRRGGGGHANGKGRGQGAGAGAGAGEAHAAPRGKMTPEQENAIRWCIEGDRRSFGLGTAKQHDSAFKFYARSARVGYPPAMARLGTAYQLGQGVAADEERSLLWFQRGARRGDLDAMNALGCLCESGAFAPRLPQDLGAAGSWYERAADKGHLDAQTNLGYLYEKGLGVPRNPRAAAFWYERAAAKGYAKAQNNLGSLFYTGVGVRGGQDYEAAVRLYMQGAEQGHASAMNNLGICKEDGLGTPVDKVGARALYEAASASGNVHAQNNLGYMCTAEGRFEEAAGHFRRAADQGSADALYSLAQLYESGRGEPRDLERAARLYRAAASAGNDMGLEGAARAEEQRTRDLEEEQQVAGAGQGGRDGGDGGGGQGGGQGGGEGHPLPLNRLQSLGEMSTASSTLSQLEESAGERRKLQGKVQSLEMELHTLKLRLPRGSTSISRTTSGVPLEDAGGGRAGDSRGSSKPSNMDAALAGNRSKDKASRLGNFWNREGALQAAEEEHRKQVKELYTLHSRETRTHKEHVECLYDKLADEASLNLALSDLAQVLWCRCRGYEAQLRAAGQEPVVAGDHSISHVMGVDVRELSKVVAGGGGGGGSGGAEGGGQSLEEANRHLGLFDMSGGAGRQLGRVLTLNPQRAAQGMAPRVYGDTPPDTPSMRAAGSSPGAGGRETPRTHLQHQMQAGLVRLNSGEVLEPVGARGGGKQTNREQ